jgi:hypothetical protein
MRLWFVSGTPVIRPSYNDINLGVLLEFGVLTAMVALPVHELSDGREDGGDGFIVSGELFVEPCFELREAAGQFLVGAEQLAQLHEGAHHVDAHLDGARAVEDRGGHDRAVLGEGVRQVLAMLAAAFWEGRNLRPSKNSFSSAVSWNMKSSGKRSRLRLTCSLSAWW